MGEALGKQRDGAGEEAIINLLPSKGTCLVQLRKHYKR